MSTNERKYRPVDLRPHEAQAAARGELRLIVRAVKPRHDWEIGERDDDSPWPYYRGYVHAEPSAVEVPCPLGQPGDGLWGRERHWRFTGCAEDGKPWPGFIESPDGNPYNARCYDDYPEMGGLLLTCAAMPVSPILMPRWASRWSAVVEYVECRLVQTITDAEAFAWGLDIEDEHASWFLEGENLQSAGSPMSAERYALMRLWQSIHGREAWDANPWCWFVWVQQDGKS